MRGVGMESEVTCKPTLTQKATSMPKVILSWYLVTMVRPKRWWARASADDGGGDDRGVCISISSQTWPRSFREFASVPPHPGVDTAR